LVALVVSVLRHIDPRLLPPATKPPDPMEHAKLHPLAKRDILQHAYDRGGAGPLLSVGQYLHEIADNPAVAVLLRSAEPCVLAEKWMRLERYYHSNNRTRIARDGDGIACERISLRSTVAPAENLLIAGILAGLFQRIGATEVALEIGGGRYPADRLMEVGRLDGEKTHRFRISWRKFTGTGLADHPTTSPSSGAEPTVGHLTSLFMSDIGRVWRLPDASRALGKSARSLQRALTAEGRSFSTVVRGARTGAAGRLLSETDHSLAEIGYCCGYADQAHFQRDFLRALNMTPANYRRIACS